MHGPTCVFWANLTPVSLQFEAWSRCMNQLLKLAAAHVDAVVLEQFMARAAAAADPQTRARLVKLCALHGAWKMLEHLGSHQAAGVVGLRPLGRHLASGAELEVRALESRPFYMENIYRVALLCFLTPTSPPQREFDALCSELRPDVGLLVDAFDIPDHIVRAPIGLQVGLYPIVTSQYRSTTLYQFSYHIQ